ncbi:MAG: FecR family protein [Candidatus Micrarchaeia archaeon]
MRPAVVWLIIISIFVSFAYAGSCPAGSKDCFLCGGVNGIPCISSCTGSWSEKAHAYVSCECPQGEPCICYCPAEGQGPVVGVGKGGTENAFAKLASFSGNVYLRMPNGEWARIVTEIPINEKSAVKTGSDGKITMNIADGSKVYMDENTELEMKELKRKNLTTFDVIIELAKGAIFSDVTKRGDTIFRVKSGATSTGVKGTKFHVAYDNAKGETTVKVVEGEVTVTDKYGKSIVLTNNQMVISSDSKGIGGIQKIDDETEKSGACAGGLIFLISVLTFAAYKYVTN